MPRVLVVDDEKNIRVTLRAFLQGEGYEVEIAENADRARALLSNGVWDVVVTDIVLPGVSGIELLKTIRAAAPEVQVIMMTGEPTAETAAEAVRAGARDYLTKPVIKNAILRSVATAVQMKQIEDEKRRLQEENRKYQDNLEKLVTERTHALQDTNQRLEEALAEIQRTQEETIKQERLSALGQMVSGIAHDFNNALMPIMGLPAFLLAHPQRLDNKTEVIAALQDVLAAAGAARDIVRRLREFYRPLGGIEVGPVDLGKLIRQVIDLMAPAWKAQAQVMGKCITIETDLETVAPILANESGLREVLTNLLVNAIDAIPANGTIRFATRQEPGHAVIRVSDTGAGMPAEVRRRCFEPFYSTKGEHGTGLGLAVCYGIVQRHGGEIAVESEEGRGTTFMLRLPIEPPSGVRASAAESEEKVDATPLRVLVIDDEESSRSILTLFLSADGHTVQTVDSGPAALQVLRQAGSDFDLVVTDRAMMGMGGDEVAVAVKTLTQGAPVLMLTGFGDLMKYEQEHPPGVDEIVGKPLTSLELRQAMRRALEKNRGSGRAGPADER